jgi:hypothetical protein
MPKSSVVTRVLLQHLVQFVVAYVAMVLDPDQCSTRCDEWLCEGHACCGHEGCALDMHARHGACIGDRLYTLMDATVVYYI